MVAGGRLAPGPHEAWIAVDPFKGGFRVLITGPQGFERKLYDFPGGAIPPIGHLQLVPPHLTY